jgi:transcriptional regulator with XRE-family HTH domain
VGEDIRRLREDAGVSKTAVAAIAGIDRTYLTDIEDGRVGVSLESLNRVAAALNANLNLRLFPNAGPRIRDRFQAPMIEALLNVVAPAYERHLEVPVYRPARGVIDLVLALVGRIISVEAHSDLRRLEQQLRWAAEKSDALPSSAIWPALAAPGVTTAISRILVLRSTSRTRSLVRDFSATFAAAYPADPGQVLRALAQPAEPWPGSGLLWTRVEAGRATILPGPPRGVGR